MNNSKTVEWILRVAITGEYVGHGMLALQGKKDWVAWIQQFTATDAADAGQLLFLIGLADLFVALVVLVKPLKFVLLWAAVWGFWTALLRPLVGLPIWDFIERWANWGAPLALLYLLGWPGHIKEWWK